MINRRKLITHAAAVWMLLALLSFPVKGKAGALYPGHPVTDTVPPVQQPPAETGKSQLSSTPVTEVVKQVPKSRKQVKPVALPPVGVKVPVKPKIIKPTIRRVTGLIP